MKIGTRTVGWFAASCCFYACGPGSLSKLPKATRTGEAFEGVQCSAVRAPTEPYLMAWDSGSRASLNYLRSQGVVAVRYKAEGCNVELEVLSHCIGKGQYSYLPYSATETKVLHNNQELFAELPIGAAQLGGKLKGGRALRTDYTLVGLNALPPAATFAATDLQGPECERATHIVSKVYVGGFAMAAGDSQELEASGGLFGARAGGNSQSSAEHLANEGQAEACDRAQTDGTEQKFCSVPLRIGLLAINGRAEGGCPTGATWDGTQCVQKRVVTEIDCPAGTELRAGRCVGSVVRTCNAGWHFEDGRGCVPDVIAAPAPRAAPPAPNTGVSTSSAPAADMVHVEDDRQEFWIDRTEVTVAAYTACVRSGKCTEPSSGDFCNWGKKGDQPINCVDWNQAVAFCQAQGKRLPTEEEWALAAYGTDGRKYPWGNADPSSQACWNRWNSKQGTCRVGAFPSGASPFGALDMAGNVWEWTASNYDANACVFRGGGWDDGVPARLSSSFRLRPVPSYRGTYLGFRCAR